MFLFGMLSFIPTYIQVEKQVGTFRAGYRYFVTAFTTALVFVVISILFSKLFGISTLVYMGIWPIIISEIVIECFSSPDT